MTSSSSSSNRNPKILRELIQNVSSQQAHLEISEMSGATNSASSTPKVSVVATSNSARRASPSVPELDETIKNLRNLSAEDKTEVGLLKSRIEEQSRLIMILKQRGDDYITKNMSLERQNQELAEQKEKLHDDLKLALSNFASLNENFKYLSENHEALIRIKDEYKDRVKVLEAENNQISKRLQEKKFTSEIDDEEKKLLTKSLNDAKYELTSALEKNNRLENELDRVQVVANQQEVDLKITTRELESLRKTNKDINEKFNELSEKLQQLKQIMLESNETNLKKIDLMVKEKNDLALMCDSLKKEKISLSEANERIEKNYKSVVAELNKLKEKLSKESMNEKLMEANIRYQNLEKDFEAYKKYATSLIEREKELNNKLRYIFS